jgi:hypothetical protein
MVEISKKAQIDTPRAWVDEQVIVANQSAFPIPQRNPLSPEILEGRNENFFLRLRARTERKGTGEKINLSQFESGCWHLLPLGISPPASPRQSDISARLPAIDATV